MASLDRKTLSKWWPFPLKGSHANRTYIIPTRFGLYFGLSMFLLLAVAFIYSNNVVYFICFFLTSLAHIVMWSTNSNISRLRVDFVQAPDFFADEKGRLRILITNQKNTPSYLIRVNIPHENQQHLINEISALSQQSADLLFSASHRGYQKIPSIIAESRYPFGLLKSWKHKKISNQVLVYPKREGNPRLPEKGKNQGADSLGRTLQLSSENAFQGHRPYQASDSFRQMDWKAFARTQELLIKQFESENKGQLQLRWEDTGFQDPEKKLSQLSLWISECEKQHRIYQLALPDETTPWGKGSAHAHECLKKLALYRWSTSE